MGWIKFGGTSYADPDLTRLRPMRFSKLLTIRAIGYIDNEGRRLLER
jgi:hypothetical protein